MKKEIATGAALYSKDSGVIERILVTIVPDEIDGVLRSGRLGFTVETKHYLDF